MTGISEALRVCAAFWNDAWAGLAHPGRAWPLYLYLMLLGAGVSRFLIVFFQGRGADREGKKRSDALWAVCWAIFWSGTWVSLHGRYTAVDRLSLAFAAGLGLILPFILPPVVRFFFPPWLVAGIRNVFSRLARILYAPFAVPARWLGARLSRYSAFQMAIAAVLAGCAVLGGMLAFDLARL
jgi:hypothetical protein